MVAVHIFSRGAVNIAAGAAIECHLIIAISAVRHGFLALVTDIVFAVGCQVAGGRTIANAGGRLTVFEGIPHNIRRNVCVIEWSFHTSLCINYPIVYLHCFGRLALVAIVPLATGDYSSRRKILGG